VGREVGADGQPCFGDQRFDRARDGGLAVRADDVDGRIAELWIPEVGEDGLDAIEAEPTGRPGAERLDPLDDAVAQNASR
jgi:hypothetical protein